MSRPFDEKTFRDKQAGHHRPAENDKTKIAVTIEGGEQQLITLVDTSLSNFIYIGTASPSTISSEPRWRIQRVDLATTVIEILFAESSEDFVNVWDDRTTYTYG